VRVGRWSCAWNMVLQERLEQCKEVQVLKRGHYANPEAAELGRGKRRNKKYVTCSPPPEGTWPADKNIHKYIKHSHQHSHSNPGTWMMRVCQNCPNLSMNSLHSAINHQIQNPNLAIHLPIILIFDCRAVHRVLMSRSGSCTHHGLIAKWSNLNKNGKNNEAIWSITSTCYPSACFPCGPELFS